MDPEIDKLKKEIADLKQQGAQLREQLQVLEILCADKAAPAETG